MPLLKEAMPTKLQISPEAYQHINCLFKKYYKDNFFLNIHAKSSVLEILATESLR